MSDLVKICNRVIEGSFYALFFLVPLILSPWNFELFEFNKMMIVYVLTAIIGCAWLIKMVLQRRIIFQRSFWDIPLVIFLLSQVLSTMFSIDRHTSFFGYYSRFNGGLLSTICYLLLYWAFVSNMNFSHPRGGGAPAKRGRHLGGVFNCLLFSATLVAAYGIAEHFGIDAKYWVQDVKNRVFSTLGQPNWLAAWLAALIPLTWAFALNSKLKTQNSKLQGKIQNFLNSEFTFYILHFTFYICLLYTRSRSGLLGFGIAYLAFWPLVFWSHRHNWKAIFTPFLVFSFSFLVLTFVAGRDWAPGINKIFQTHNSQTEKTEQSQPQMLISESGDIRKVVWKGAMEIWRHYPLLGTGPETFAYSYYWYRPREHNDLSEWDFLYNKAHNEYLNYAATTGTIGLVSYLILIGSFILWSLKKIINYQLSIINSALTAGFASIVVTNFFGFSIVPIQLLFFLFPAMAVRNSHREWNRSYTLGIGQWLVIGIILLFTFYFLLFTLKYWYADTRFAFGEKLNKAYQYDKAFSLLQKAVQLHPGEPFYHDELSGTAASLALSAFQQNQATLSAQLTALAVSESSKAIKVSPYNLNFWKNRTKAFYKLAGIDEKHNQLALDSLLRAGELAPTDPKIQYNLGLLYARVGQQQAAIKSLEKTVELKPNYIDARYALALFYEQTKEKEKAIAQLKYIIEKINPNHQPTVEKLKELTKKP